MSAHRHTLGYEVKETVLLAGPVVGSLVAQHSMSFVDTVMVGRLGSEALAGVALGSNVYSLLLVMSMGAVVSVGPMASQAFGAGRAAEVGRAVRQGLWLALLLAAAAMPALWHLAPLLRLAGQDPATVATATGYIRAVLWDFFPALGFIVLRSGVEAVSRPWPVTLITVAGFGLNIGLNDVLMYGRFGLPALGVVGTGLATSVVMWCMLGALAAYIRLVRRFAPYRASTRPNRPEGPYLRELARIGWPVAVSHGVESGLFTATALLVGMMGTVALAAHQVALQCAALAFMVPLGVGIATSVRVGHAVGRRDAPGLRWAGAVGIGLGAVFMLGTGITFWAAPGLIIGLFLDVADPANAPVVRLAVTLLGIAAVFQVFDGVQVASSGALRGLKDTRTPMLIGLVSYWGVGLTAGYAAAFVFGGGAPGLWWGLVSGLATAAVLLSGRFWRLARRPERLYARIGPEDEPAALPQPAAGPALTVE